MIRRTLGQDRMTSRFGVLNILLDKSDTEDLATFVGAFPNHCRNTTMKEGVEFLKDRCFSDSRFRLVTTNIQVLLKVLDCWSTYMSATAHPAEGRLTFFNSWLEVSVHPQNMLRNLSVSLLIRIVSDDKEQIETRQQRVGQSDISVWIFVDIVLMISLLSIISQWRLT
jgi:hypothetical protein